MKTARERFKKFIEDFYLVLVLIFLYAPILVMMVLSFNSSKSRSQWGGFTLKWYTQMFESATIMDALPIWQRTVSEVYFRLLFSDYPYLPLCPDFYYDGPFF